MLEVQDQCGGLEAVRRQSEANEQEARAAHDWGHLWQAHEVCAASGFGQS